MSFRLVPHLPRLVARERGTTVADRQRNRYINIFTFFIAELLLCIKFTRYIHTKFNNDDYFREIKFIIEQSEKNKQGVTF